MNIVLFAPEENCLLEFIETEKGYIIYHTRFDENTKQKVKSNETVEVSKIEGFELICKQSASWAKNWKIE